MDVTPPQHEQMNLSWEEIPPIRRHIYFYLLVVLGSIVCDTLGGNFVSQGRLAFAPSTPPRITSSEVYPAPVQAVSPSPSEPLQ